MLATSLMRPLLHPLQICAGATAVAASLIAAPSRSGLFGAGLAILVVAIAASDARSFRIPNELNLSAFALGLVRAAVITPDDPISAIGLAIIRSALLAVAFLALRIAYRRIRGREGIGLGDVKLAGVAGVWLDWFTMPVAIEIAALAALVAYVARQHIAGRVARPTDRLPFGLFFAPAIWLGWIIETAQLVPQLAI
jgi:leader peptidase (prepilin peptidase) / N-methyltransferase